MLRHSILWRNMEQKKYLLNKRYSGIIFIFLQNVNLVTGSRPVTSIMASVAMTTVWETDVVQRAKNTTQIFQVQFMYFILFLWLHTYQVPVCIIFSTSVSILLSPFFAYLPPFCPLLVSRIISGYCLMLTCIASFLTLFSWPNSWLRGHFNTFSRCLVFCLIFWKGCRYGDKIHACESSMCHTYSNKRRDDCCSTCDPMTSSTLPHDMTSEWLTFTTSQPATNTTMNPSNSSQNGLPSKWMQMSSSRPFPPDFGKVRQ